MPAVVHNGDDDVPLVLDGFFLSCGRQFLGYRQGDDFFVGELRPCSPAAQQASTPNRAMTLFSRWREMRVCNDNVCGGSKRQNSHDSLVDLTFVIAATDPKASID